MNAVATVNESIWIGQVSNLTAADIAMLTPLPSAEGFSAQLAQKLTSVRKPKRTEFSREANKYPPTLENAKLAIVQMGIRLRYNRFHRRTEVEGYDKPLGETFADTALKLRDLIVEEFGFDPGTRNVEDAAQLLAEQNAFDPVADYLSGLEWDGQARLDMWLVRFMGAVDEPLTRAIGRAVLIAGVRRVRKPGSKFDYMMVLEGSQGTGKSTALKILAGGDDLFTDALDFQMTYKEHQELLQGKWLVEAPELDGLGRADVRRVKQFISKTHDRARAAFARHVDEVPRRCILIGTTNDDEYLSDPSGNRRFWPVRTGVIDLVGLAAARDQLWAEAARAERVEPDPITIPQALWADAGRRQEERVAVDPWEDLLVQRLPRLAKLVEGEWRIPSTDVAEHALGLVGAREMRQADAKRIATCMRRLGWEGPKVVKWKGAAVRAYVRREADMDGDGYTVTGSYT